MQDAGEEQQRVQQHKEQSAGVQHCADTQPEAAQQAVSLANKAGSSDGSCDAPAPPLQRRRSKRLQEQRAGQLPAGTAVEGQTGQQGPGATSSSLAVVGQAAVPQPGAQVPAPAAQAAPALLQGIPVCLPLPHSCQPMLMPPGVGPQPLQQSMVQPPSPLQQALQAVQQPAAPPAFAAEQPSVRHAGEPPAPASGTQSVLQTAIAAAAQAQQTVLEVSQLAGPATVSGVPEVSAALAAAPAGSLLSALGGPSGLPHDNAMPSLQRIGSIPSLSRAASSAAPSVASAAHALSPVEGFAGLAQPAGAGPLSLLDAAAAPAAEPPAGHPLPAQQPQHARQFAAPPVPRFSTLTQPAPPEAMLQPTGARQSPLLPPQPQPAQLMQQAQHPLLEGQPQLPHQPQQQAALPAVPGMQAATLLPQQPQAAVLQPTELPSAFSHAARAAAAAAANLTACMPMAPPPIGSCVPMAVPAGAATLSLSSLPLAALALPTPPLALPPLPTNGALPVLPTLSIQHHPHQQICAVMPRSAALAAALASQQGTAGLLMPKLQQPAAQLPLWTGSTMLQPAPTIAVSRMPSVASSSAGQGPRKA